MSRLGARLSTGLLRCSLPGRISRGPFGWTRPSSMELRRTRLSTGFKPWSNVVSPSSSRTTAGWCRTLCRIRAVRPQSGLTRRLWRTEKRSPHGRSLRIRFAPCTSRRTTKCCFRRTLWRRHAKQSLQEYVQKMCSLSASITVGPIPEHIKVPTFMNGLRHGPSRQALLDE